MSSLGDLLLGNVSEPPKSPPPPPPPPASSSSDNKHRKSTTFSDGKGSDSPTNNNNQEVKRSPRSGDIFGDTHPSIGQKVFPSRIEKNTIAEDCQSNASSVDDYVAELLDPNDRPRNVWHVVEGPKESPGRNGRDRDDVKRESDVEMMKKRTRQHSDDDDDDDDEDNYGPPPPRDNDRQARDSDRLSPNADIKVEREAQQDNNEINLIYSPTKRIKDEELEEERPKYFDDPVKSMPLARDDELPPKSSPALSKDRQDNVDKEEDNNSKRRGSRERSSSSRRHRHDRDRERDRESHRDRDRERRSDRDRRRSSPDRYSKSSSSRRRRDYSDDEDEDRRKRHRGGRSSRRHGGGRGSRSRSRSTSMSRRRVDRSRSRSQSPVTQRNSRTILIMQLSQRVEERDLEDHFSDIGRVREVRLILDSKTRRHKGIAYIEFDDAASASKALAQNGQMFHGVPMQIQSALVERGARGSERHSTTSTSSSSHHHHHQQQQQQKSLLNHNTTTTSSSSTTTHTSSRPPLPPNSYRVYMGGLHVGITEEMLRTIVEPFGMVHKVEVIKDRTTGFSRGYAFVTFASIEDGQEAVRNLDGFELAGKNMRVSKSTEKIGHQ